MSLQVICFSKDRPLQLHGYLRSLYEHEIEAQVKVLVQSQPKWFTDAYAEVQREFPKVEWCHEQDFRLDLMSLIGDTDYTMFGCDDVVFTSGFNPDELVCLNDPDLLGLSLRLGLHITHDMFGNPMHQPPMETGPMWKIQQAEGDWGYPWEVLGTVYETDFAKRMVARVQANSPSQLEERGWRCWSEETPKRSMASWPVSKLVVPTVNIVQEEFPNGIVGNVQLEPGFLLDCWNHGLRLDTEAYEGVAPESWRIPDFFLRRVL